jgi:RHS repeat-associated protein
MKKTFLFIAFLTLILRGVTIAQNPYESLGVPMPKGKMLTVSNGRFQEHFPNDTLTPIGSAMFNTVTGEVVQFLTRDTMYAEYNLEPELVSRWLSPDPLAEKYYQWSPYNFVLGNPIKFVDPDGRAVDDIIVKGSAGGKDKADQTQFRSDFINHLQSLTNDKVELHEQSNGDYKVVITEAGTANAGQTLAEGTNLISTLVGDDKHTTTVTDGKASDGGQDRNHTTLTNGTKDIANAANGVGANATVHYQRNEDMSGMAYKEGTTGKNTNAVVSGLGHELMHADDITHGKANGTISNYKDADMNGKSRPMRQNEVDVRNRENIMRQEHGIRPRAIPVKAN